MLIVVVAVMIYFMMLRVVAVLPSPGVVVVGSAPDLDLAGR
jgi:hypothetical protein